MTGRVERAVGAKKDFESWNADAWEYFVLVRDDLPADRESDRRVMLRATQAFPEQESFKVFAGKRVELHGRLAGYIEFTPDPMMQQPTTSLNDDTKARKGGGVLVDGIRIINADSDQGKK